HAPEVRAFQSVPDAVSDVDLLHRDDACIHAGFHASHHHENSMKRFLPLLALATSIANAQCVMCYRTAAAQQMERARVLNIGILFRGVPPFLILAGFLLLCWRRSETYTETDVEQRQ